MAGDVCTVRTAYRKDITDSRLEVSPYLFKKSCAMKVASTVLRGVASSNVSHALDYSLWCKKNEWVNDKRVSCFEDWYELTDYVREHDDQELSICVSFIMKYKESTLEKLREIQQRHVIRKMKQILFWQRLIRRRAENDRLELENGNESIYFPLFFSLFIFAIFL